MKVAWVVVQIYGTVVGLHSPPSTFFCLYLCGLEKPEYPSSKWCADRGPFLLFPLRLGSFLYLRLRRFLLPLIYFLVSFRLRHRLSLILGLKLRLRPRLKLKHILRHRLMSLNFD